MMIYSIMKAMIIFHAPVAESNMRVHFKLLNLKIIELKF